MSLIKNIWITLLITSTFQCFGQNQPNIVLLFVDDYGWMDVGFNNKKFHTPNINQLKKDGLNFNRAYIATPTCSPSRASLLTGKEPVRFQMTRHIPNNPKFGFKHGRTNEPFNVWKTDPAQRPSRNWLPLAEKTYAEELKQLGYYNLFIGKWHLGHEKYYPTKQGFDEEFGVSNFGHPKSYYPPFFKAPNPLKGTPEEEYLTDVLTAKATDFIKTFDKKQPFMLSLWYYNVHSPFIGRKDWVAIYKKEGLIGKVLEYAAMVSTMDESVGKIRDALTVKGIADNTVLLFLSDQGGYFSQAPLSGGKRGGNTLGEGGARVPFIVYYPNVTTANTSCEVPVQSIDIYPTLMEIATGKYYKNNAIQGKSLMPLFKNKKFKKRALYFFRSYEDQSTAVMCGNWKLKKYLSGKYELYNVATDISESYNLIDKETKKANKLKKNLTKWEVEVLGKE